MTLGGRVAVMRDGAIEQVAPPLDVYARPVNTFVARFIGAPAMNLVPRRSSGSTRPQAPWPAYARRMSHSAASGQLHATVDVVEPRGHDYVVHLRLDPPGVDPLLAVVAGGDPPPVGARCSSTVSPERLHLFDGGTGTRLP